MSPIHTRPLRNLEAFIPEFSWKLPGRANVAGARRRRIKGRALGRPLELPVKPSAGSHCEPERGDGGGLHLAALTGLSALVGSSGPAAAALRWLPPVASSLHASTGPGLRQAAASIPGGDHTASNSPMSLATGIRGEGSCSSDSSFSSAGSKFRSLHSGVLVEDAGQGLVTRLPLNKGWARA